MKIAPTFLLLVPTLLFPHEARSGTTAVNVVERQVTRGPGGKILTNAGVWSPDGEWIVYDQRPDAAGEVFEGAAIEMVHVRTGEARELYHAARGARCGVASFNPRRPEVVFILGPENPSPDWSYAPWHRQGVVVAADPGAAGPARFQRLDARDLTPPFTPGALRGGTHLHVWDGAGKWVAFTYEDHLLAQNQHGSAARDANLRNVGVAIPGHPVRAGRNHPRNHDGDYFSVLVTRTTARPRPGSDEIRKASEEAWVGTNGYVRADGTRQHRALAFQGRVVDEGGRELAEVFLADLPEDPTLPGEGPLAGTETRLPGPPRGTTQRRLTRTAGRKFPGLQGPRHWLRSSPDGTRIAFLMKDDDGVVQIWTISPNGGPPRQVTRNNQPVSGTLTWSPDGERIAYVMDNSVCATETASGRTWRLTPRTGDATAPRPEACVFSPDGRDIAFIRRAPSPEQECNQICVVSWSALDKPER